MRTFLATHNKAFRAEAQKLRHSGMLWLCLGAAAFVPVLMTVIGFFMPWDTPVEQRWDRVIQNSLFGFTGFFYPLFVIIMMVRLVYLEHRSDTWKLIETQPVSKAAIYLSKWEIGVLISLVSLLGLLLFAVIGGYALQLGRPSIKLDESSVDWAKAFKIVSRYWVASLGLISIQYFFSLLIKSFAWPLSIGLIANIAGSIFAGFGLLNWWPYSATVFTTQSFDGSVSGTYLMAHEKISLLWSLLFLWLGYQLFRRKTFNMAFFKPLSNLAITAAIVAVFIAIVWVVNKPSEVPPYQATVIAGSIDSKTPVANVTVLRPPLMDTLFSIPVKNNKFHLRTDEAMPTGVYYLRAGNNRAEVFMGNKDSVYVDWSIVDRDVQIKISGTRLAENAYLQQPNNDNLSYLVDFAYDQTPLEFAKAVLGEWKDRVKHIEKFKTVDRIKPAPDFLSMQKKLIAMRLLNIIDVEYPKVHAAYYPNEELKYPKGIDRLRKEAAMNAPELVSFPSYRNYVRTSLRQKAGISDSAFFTSINDSLKDSYTRDVVLFEAAQETIFRMRDSAMRNLAVNRMVAGIHDEKIRTRLIESNNRANNLQRGKKAFDFLAESLIEKDVRLSSLLGKYVIIDFWATWCAPCKKESPYFEDYAQRFTNKEVVFVSLSVDEDKKAWKFQASYNKNKRVLQLLAKDESGQMSEAFALTSIPRFMLIDPKGNIIHSQLPFPSEPEFEATLQKEIPSLSRF